MSFKHKHKTSHTAEDLNKTLFGKSPFDMQRQEMSEALISSPTQSSTTTVMRKAPSKTLEDRDRGSVEQNLTANAATTSISGTDVQPEAVFVVRGTRVRAGLTRVGLQLTALQGPALPCIGRAVLGLTPYDEILAAERAERDSIWRGTCCTGRRHTLVIQTIRRSIHNKCQWRRRAIKLHSSDPDVVADWQSRIQRALRSQPHRPRELLVILNPFGGARAAAKIWRQVAAPCFDAAGIHYQVTTTEREGHAKDIVEELPASRLQTLDGIVVVGGDGLFQEALNGLMTVRAGADPAAASAAAALRLGHVPAGSTDAVAFSLNGTRSQMTAALHIALGDRMGMDVMRVDTGDGAHRYAVCVASYGYMGDLMRFSERLRWMGPSRYNTAGAITLLRGRAYQATISYRPVEEARRASLDVSMVCRSECNLCNAGAMHSGEANGKAFATPATEAQHYGTWKTIEGEFKGIMAVVTPCRSDRSTLGLFPYSHLNDGRLHLILVRKCSVLQYLRFLASIPQTGVQPGAFPYVEVLDATAVRVTPHGAESCWNVDGEILADNHFAGEVHRGLLEVFARGVE